MRPNLDTVLDECLAALRDGASVAACLKRYPEHADELRPLLAVVGEVGRVLTPPSSAAARAAGEREMLAALAAKGARQAQTPAILLGLRQFFGTFGGGFKPAWSLVAAVVAVLLVVSSGVAVASSAGSLPGDALYPVKLVSQRAQLALTFNPVRQGFMQEQFSSRQRMDIESVLAGGRQATVEFEGVLQRMEGNLWIVGGLTVTLQESTAISGEPSLGMLVRVRGELPGDGTLLAAEVRVDSSATPLVTDIVEPTETAEPAGTEEPTKTAEPTETPELADTAEPVETAEPAETVEPPEDEHLTDVAKWAESVETREPTETPELADEPESTAEPEETAELDDESDSSDDSSLDDSPQETDEPDDDRSDSTPEPDDDSDSDHDSGSDDGSGSDHGSEHDDDSSSDHDSDPGDDRDD